MSDTREIEIVIIRDREREGGGNESIEAREIVREK